MTMVLPFNLIEGCNLSRFILVVVCSLETNLKTLVRDKNKRFLMKAVCPFTFRYSWLHMVKFYPETLVSFDQPIQTAVRGDLPDYLTILFRAITLD